MVFPILRTTVAYLILYSGCFANIQLKKLQNLENVASDTYQSSINSESLPKNMIHPETYVSNGNVELHNFEKNAETIVDDVPAISQSRQAATGPTPAELFSMLPLAILGLEAPIALVLMAFVITNLSLISVGRAEMTQNLANAEEVLANINGFAGAPGRKINTSLTHDDESSSEENHDLKHSMTHKQGYVLQEINSNQNRRIILVSLVVLAFMSSRFGLTVGVLSGVFTYLIVSKYLSSISHGHRKLAKSHNLSRTSNENTFQP